MSSSSAGIELGRYRPFLAAGVLVALGLLVFELVGSLSLGWSPRMFWTGKVPNEWYDWRNNGRLVAGAQLARQKPDARGLGLMVGASTTHYSLTPEALDRCDGQELDWLVITSTRMSFTVMEENVFEPLAMSPDLASPKILVMAIHPEMLVGASEGRPTFADAVSSLTAALERRRLREAAEAAARASFIIHIRGRIANTLETHLTRARVATLGALGQSLPVIFYPPLDPSRSRIPAAGNTHAFFPDRVMPGFVAAWNAAGFADPQKYSARGEQADALRRILKRYPGLPVVFIVMPVRSEFRASQPNSKIDAVWNELFEEAARSRSVSVVDLSAQLSNDAFKDVGHVNLKGRPILQKLTARALVLATDARGAVPVECAPDGQAAVTVERIRGR